MFRVHCFILCALFFVGCSSVTETAKIVAGTSIKALEEDRINAKHGTYLCDVDQCFEAIKSLDRDDELLVPRTEKFFDVFTIGKDKRYLVVMGIVGNVDTTEVGIFFNQEKNAGITRIEITSRSSSAKQKVADAVFAELDLRFSKEGS